MQAALGRRKVPVLPAIPVAEGGRQPELSRSRAMTQMKTNSRKTLIWSSFLINLFSSILSFGQPTANMEQPLGGLCVGGNAVRIKVRLLVPCSGIAFWPLGRLQCLPQGRKLAADLSDNDTLFLCFHLPSVDQTSPGATAREDL